MIITNKCTLYRIVRKIFLCKVLCYVLISSGILCRLYYYQFNSYDTLNSGCMGYGKKMFSADNFVTHVGKWLPSLIFHWPVGTLKSASPKIFKLKHITKIGQVDAILWTSHFQVNLSVILEFGRHLDFLGVFEAGEIFGLHGKHCVYVR